MTRKSYIDSTNAIDYDGRIHLSTAQAMDLGVELIGAAQVVLRNG